jgi:transposase-like protein
VYVWADGSHVQARPEDAEQCLLVIVSATPEGKKELVGQLSLGTSLSKGCDASVNLVALQ